MKTRSTALALALVLPLGLAACGSEEPESAPAPAASSPAASQSVGDTAADSAADSAADPAAQVFGAACSAVPMDGKGSFNGMATDPVATAASNNPLLTTLVAAVKEAGLVDTLNSAPEITVFAPVDDAFAKIPEADLTAVLADKPTLTKILTNHVVAGSLSPAEVAGTHETLAGTQLTVSPAGDSFTVGKEKATVLCGNVPTANATVYIVDTVLMP